MDLRILYIDETSTELAIYINVVADNTFILFPVILFLAVPYSNS